MGKTTVILNPGAGHQNTGRFIEFLQSRARRSPTFDLRITRSRSHLEEVARSSFREYSNLILAGGDSTFAIAVNAILRGMEAHPETELRGRFHGKRLGILARGSANDIARELRTESLDDLLQAIRAERTRPMDLGLMTVDGHPRWFLGSASIGLGATVNRFIEGFKNRHPRWSRFPLVRHTLMGMFYIGKSFRQGRVPVPVILEENDRHLQKNVTLLVFLNGSTYGGGLRFFPGTHLFDGQLTAVMVDTPTCARTLGLAFRIMAGGSRSPRGIQRFPGRQFSVTGTVPFTVQYDGEITAPCRHLQIRLKKAVLPVLVGPGFEFPPPLV